MQNSNLLRLGAALLMVTVAMGTTARLSAATTLTATTLRAVKVVRETASTSTSNTSWTWVPGAEVWVTIPGNTTDTFVVRFSAESVCAGSAGWCPVRILLYGNEMEPAVGTDFAFDSSDAGTASPQGWKAHSMERSITFNNTFAVADTVLIQVQYMTTNAGMTFRLDDWHLTVEQYH